VVGISKAGYPLELFCDPLGMDQGAFKDPGGILHSLQARQDAAPCNIWSTNYSVLVILTLALASLAASASAAMALCS
jgi:hypothetical protein